MNEPASDRSASEYIAGEAKTTFQLVGISLVIAMVLAAVALGLFGGWSLLHYALTLLFTWDGAFRALCVIAGLTFVTWVRHVTTYRYAAPMWFRRSWRTNVIEALVLAAVILAGIWAFHRFLPPPSP